MTFERRMSLDGKSVELHGNRECADDVSSLAMSNLGSRSIEVPTKHARSGRVEIFNFFVGRKLADHGLEKGVPVLDCYDGDGEARNYKVNQYDDGANWSCVPPWIVDASPAVKIIIIASTALLVGSIVLVIVAAVLSTGGGSNGSGSANLDLPGSSSHPNIEPTLAPTVPTTSISVMTVPSSSPSPPSTSTPLDTPTSSPTKSPILITMPTAIPDIIATTTFYVTASSFSDKSLETLQKDLPLLPASEGQWIVHLGDFNHPLHTTCEDASYSYVADLYSASAVPVYFLPGDSDWNDCPSQISAETSWNNHLLRYDEKFWEPPQYTVSRDANGGREENFVFELRNVLYIGLNMIGGTIVDQTDWDSRLLENFNWVKSNVESNLSTVEVVVIFGHSGLDPENANFFDPLAKLIPDWDVPVLYIQETSKSWDLQQQAMGLTKFMILSVQGGVWPPMKVTVDIEKNTFNFDQGDWFYLAGEN